MLSPVAIVRLTAAILVLLAAAAKPAFVQADSAAPQVRAPIAMSSGLDLTRATIAVAINGRRYACVLDTGTSTMLVSQAVAQAAALPLEAPVEEIAPDGLRYADRHAHIERFEAGGYAMRDLPALVSSKLSGDTVLCGYDFFARIPTLIDRDTRVVTLFPPTATLDRMRCLPIDLTAHVPVASLHINGAWLDGVVLDSGMVGGGAIWAGAAGRFAPPLTVAPGYQSDPRAARNGLVCGLNATIGLFDGAAGDTIALCTSSRRPDGYNGILETNLPTVHQIAIDYPRRRLCFSTGPPLPLAFRTSSALARD